MTRHVISLVITSNDIPLSSPIALTYHLVPDGSLFRYTKPHSSIVGNRLFTSHCWEVHQLLSHLLRSSPAAIPFVGKHSLRHHTVLRLISPPLPSPLPPMIIQQLVLRWLWANLGPFLDYIPSSEVTNCTACWTQQVRHCRMSTFSYRFEHGSCRMIDLVTTREVQSQKMDGKALCDDSRNCWDIIRSLAEA